MPIEIEPDVRYIGRRRSVWYRATLGPVVTTESTKTGARDRLIRDVETAITGSFEPAMFSLGDGRVLVYRDVNGWWFRYWSGVTPFSQDGSTISCGSQDRDTAIRSAKLYLAQCEYPEYNGLDLLAGDTDAIQDHCRWLAFQRAYEWARNEGAPDTDAHAYASRNGDATGSWLMADERAVLESVTAP